MAKIKVLTSELYNLISAGEVIENPVGAIKELVENSIDAGATRISIEVNGGGFDLIAVGDNGGGMTEDDVNVAFLKHATSKLASKDDLYAVQTLGFRGEALPSIAAVARVKLTTKHNSSDAAVSVDVENGAIVNKSYVSANVGTRVEVRDLFYNTPARRKFLKSPEREIIQANKFVAKLILTNPNLEISYFVDGKKVYQTNGGGLAEAIFAVYDAECLKNCLPISYAKNNCRVSGYIGSPDYVKANTTYQTLSVNGRLITDKNITGAVTQAFRPYLMTRKYPFFVLDLEIPFDCIDVNVHPKKFEVRFANLHEVTSACYRAVSDALRQYSDERVDKMLATERNYKTSDNDDYAKKQIRREQAMAKMEELFEARRFEIMNPDQTADVREIEDATRKADLDREFEEFAIQMEKELTVANARAKMGLAPLDQVKSPQRKTLNRDEVQPILNSVIEKDDVGDDLYSRTRILGAAFKTYLILEIEDKIILIDQHAAHERILFDKFMSSKTKDMQPLIFPYVFKAKDDEEEFIQDNKDNIAAAGIEIEDFGRNTYRIIAVSPILADAKMDEFVQYLLSGVDEYKLDDSALIVEKIARKACKAAVKGGYCLNEYEIKYILKEVYENKVAQCPHGRPVSVVFTKRQIEKMFKRIV